MVINKIVNATQLDADLTDIADAIRAKGGTSAQLAFPAGFVDAVEAIETGGGGGASSGSVTVTERTRYLTINMGGEYDHILVVQRSGTGNQYSQDGNRYTWAAWGIRGYSSPTNNTNAKGAFHTISNATGAYGAFTGNNCCVFSGDSVTFDANGITASHTAFSPYVTYDWWAW